MSGASGLLLSLSQLPSLLVSLAAIVFAAARWSRHPMASALVAVGAGISLLVRASAVTRIDSRGESARAELLEALHRV